MNRQERPTAHNKVRDFLVGSAAACFGSSSLEGGSFCTVLLSMHLSLLYLPFSFLGLGWMDPWLGGWKRWILRFRWEGFPRCKAHMCHPSFSTSVTSLFLSFCLLSILFVWTNVRTHQSPFFLIVAFHVVSSPSTWASTCRFRNARGWSNVVLRIT